MDRQLSKIEALANARSQASQYFKTSVKTSFEKNENSNTGKKSSILKTVQTSETTLEIVGTPEYKTEMESWSKGVLYTSEVKVKFKLIEKSPKKVEKKRLKPPKIVKIKKPVKVVENRKYNFEISLKSKGFDKFSKYILLIPDEVFSERVFSRKDFEKNGKYHKKVKKYLYKIRDQKLSKNIKTGKYKLSFVIYDGFFFLRENNFRSLKFKKLFKKSYQISESNFSFF